MNRPATQHLYVTLRPCIHVKVRHAPCIWSLFQVQHLQTQCARLSHPSHRVPSLQHPSFLSRHLHFRLTCHNNTVTLRAAFSPGTCRHLQILLAWTCGLISIRHFITFPTKDNICLILIQRTKKVYSIMIDNTHA